MYLSLSISAFFQIFVLNPSRFPFVVGENMTSFKTLKQISRKCTSTTSVEPPWNSANNSVVRFFPFFDNRYYYSIWAIKTGFRTTYGSAYRRKRNGPCTYNYMFNNVFVHFPYPFLPSFFFPPFSLSFLPFLFFFLFFFFPPFTHPPRLAGDPPQNRWFGRTT